MTLTPSDAQPVAWRYAINYGPDGEQNYAMVYDEHGQLVGNLRTHHAIAILTAQSALDAERQKREEAERDIAEAVRLLKHVSLALENLTPGGSEYISYSAKLGIHYADAEACIRFVKEQKTGGHNARIEAVVQRRRAEAAEASLAKANARIAELLATLTKVVECHDRNWQHQREKLDDIVPVARAALTNIEKERDDD